MDEVIFLALDSCRLAVLLASETYGARTTSFSTYNELNFVIEEPKPFYLIKMCDKWEEATTRLKLGAGIKYKDWRGGATEQVVAEIVAQFDGLPRV